MNQSNIHSNNDASKISVLLVEDIQVNAEMTAKLLSFLNCVTDIAATGKMAVKMATSNVYDIVFMDIGLPDINGFAATCEIRRRVSAEQLPIVALSADIEIMTAANCASAGMQGKVEKPVMLPDLKEALVNNVNKSTHVVTT